MATARARFGNNNNGLQRSFLALNLDGNYPSGLKEHELRQVTFITTPKGASNVQSTRTAHEHQLRVVRERLDRHGSNDVTIVNSEGAASAHGTTGIKNASDGFPVLVDPGMLIIYGRFIQGRVPEHGAQLVPQDGRLQSSVVWGASHRRQHRPWCDRRGLRGPTRRTGRPTTQDPAHQAIGCFFTC